MPAGIAGTPNPCLDFESQRPGAASGAAVGGPGCPEILQESGFRLWGVEEAPGEQVKTLGSHLERFGFSESRVKARHLYF